MTALCFFSFFIAVSPIVRRSVSLSLCLVVMSGKIFQKNEMSVNFFTVWFVLKTSYYICTVFSWY